MHSARLMRRSRQQTEGDTTQKREMERYLRCIVLTSYKNSFLMERNGDSDLSHGNEEKRSKKTLGNRNRQMNAVYNRIRNANNILLWAGSKVAATVVVVWSSTQWWILSDEWLCRWLTTKKKYEICEALAKTQNIYKQNNNEWIRWCRIQNAECIMVRSGLGHIFQDVVDME